MTKLTRGNSRMAYTVYVGKSDSVVVLEKNIQGSPVGPALVFNSSTVMHLRMLLLL